VSSKAVRCNVLTGIAVSSKAVRCNMLTGIAASPNLTLA
jgi:hypothetical protein